ncbi:FAD/NAD(P)-binding domain-containing protein [Linnemannia elongata AG-77]|uniref:FAD/NAD(P)-binding domain-containing protein n=1 Tax=Linnemannia elongata AG-77 TaxID=1314771 RepID=A0A197K841_9FUNG|nr:FAD/NAD(P)-binding domain-containing protein [Linnemannia elongata AG-77]
MSTTSDKPTILIVGAGLGGLMLGALLEKSDVPYLIFERASAVKPLGSAMSIGPTLLPIFEQLGIYDEFLTIGKYLTRLVGYKETLVPLKPLDLSPVEEFTGYGQYIVARPKLYDLILKQVPPHKIHFGHRVLNITEKDDKVAIHLSNSNTFEGDIIVGADGAYSAVRQRMYEQLKAEGLLPKSDQEDLPFSCTCLVGQTKVLDPEEFPIVAEPQCHFNNLYGDDKPFTWHTFNTAQGTLCWMVLHHLSRKTSKAAMEQRFRHSENSEWGDYPAQTMCEETRNFPIQLLDGKKRTLGDLYDQTPKEFISKVMLEEKVFTTWHYRRYVLMGDACHKLNPAGGHGAVTAMHDAIALANLFYAMPAKTGKDITKIFEEYQKERLPAVTESFNNSQQLAKTAGRGIVGAIILYLTTLIPAWLWRIAMAKTIRFRPQVGFLPAIVVKGSVAPVVSVSEQRARAVFEKQQQVAASV